MAEDADDLVIATDYDREGELIGLEALQEVVEANPELATAEGVHEDGTPVKRARYSALTKDEIERAFDNLDELSMPLANAGAARQDIDLIWGATLTRSVSMATRRFGANFLSVGRVQSPTLGPDRPARARAPRPRARALLGGHRDLRPPRRQLRRRAHHRQVLEGGRGQGSGRQLQEPRHGEGDQGAQEEHPQAADAAQHHRLHHRRLQPARHHARRGRCGSPRTSTWTATSPTRGPTTPSTRTSLDTEELVKQLVAVDDFKAAEFLLDGRSLEPTRGKKETTDHPPIYPTAGGQPEASRGALGGPPQGLRAGRPPLPRHLLAADDQRVDPGQHRTAKGPREGRPTSCAARSCSTRASPRIYTYARSADTEIPKLEEGQELDLEGVELEGKETPPPPRISQGKLIEMMEERGLGTKATRADIIQKLYDRGYVFGNPPEPSETGIAMSKAFEHYVPRMATPDMTAEMEAEMDQIAAGEMTKDQVLADSRDMLRSAFDEMGDDVRREDEDAKWRKFAREVWARHGPGPDPGPLHRLPGGRPQAGGRLAEHAADHQGAQVGQALRRLLRLGRRQPRLTRLLRPDLPAAPARFHGLYKIEEICSVCGRTPRVCRWSLARAAPGSSA